MRSPLRESLVRARARASTIETESMNRLSPSADDTHRSSAQSTQGDSPKEALSVEREATQTNGALPASPTSLALSFTERFSPSGVATRSPVSEIVSTLTNLYTRSQAAGISPETRISELPLSLPPLPQLPQTSYAKPDKAPSHPLESLTTPELGRLSAKRPSKTASLTPQQVIEALHRELPVGLELHRAYHYQVPFSKKSRLDVVVLKLYCPSELEQKLTEWRLRMDD